MRRGISGGEETFASSGSTLWVTGGLVGFVSSAFSYISLDGFFFQFVSRMLPSSKCVAGVDYYYFQLGDIILSIDEANRSCFLFFSVPVGRSGGDGLSYPVNPRFDAEGRWRRREEWPEHLR